MNVGVVFVFVFRLFVCAGVVFLFLAFSCGRAGELSNACRLAGVRRTGRGCCISQSLYDVGTPNGAASHAWHMCGVRSAAL